MTRIPRRICTAVCLVALAALLAASCGGSTSTPRATTPPTPTALVDIGAGLTGPAGARARVYTTGVVHASVFAFDADERLWVATAAYTDTGRDGVYLVSRSGTTPVEVISRLHTVLGLLWYHDSLYVASKDRVDTYSDLRATRFGAHRTIVTLPADVGEVNNIVLAPNGSMLLGITAPCDHCTPTSKYSGAILSFAPDGSALHVYASGIRAPVGLTFLPGTSDLLVTMDMRDDLGPKTTGDTLAVVAPGTAWRNPECYGQGGAGCAGVPASVAVLDKHAAVSDVAIVTSTTGGTSAIVAEWALGKLLRVELTKSGATYRGTVSTFVTGIKNPVAVAKTPAGDLIAADWTTGTIYRITMP